MATANRMLRYVNEANDDADLGAGGTAVAELQRVKEQLEAMSRPPAAE